MQKTVELYEVVEEIRREKKSIYFHIENIEDIIKKASSDEERKQLYLELSPKLSRYYALLQKHNEQLLDAIRIFYKDMDGGSFTLDSLQDI